MNRLLRLSPALVAGITVAAAVAITSPASALDAPQPTTVSKPSVLKRHAVWQGSRRMVHRAVSYYDRRYAPVASEGWCTGTWCGRQFVLMIGIGF